jgi:hypothetical protein
MPVEITEEQRQAMLLALAELARLRPGWDMMLCEIAVALAGRNMYAEFKRLNADRVSASDLRRALDESLKLQAHYAKVLNMWDGGDRLIFENAEEWIERTKVLVHPGILPV